METPAPANGANGTHKHEGALAAPQKPARPALPEPEKKMLEALHGKLLDILTRPLNPRTLLELEKTARLARELLVVSKDPRATRDPYSKYASEDSSSWSSDGITISTEGSNVVYGNNPGYDAPIPEDFVEPGFELVPMGGGAKSPRNENYGATIVRELLSMKGALGQREPSPTEIITAIALAREKGLDDIAKKLEEQLLGEPEVKAIEAKGTTTP